MEGGWRLKPRAVEQKRVEGLLADWARIVAGWSIQHRCGNQRLVEQPKRSYDGPAATLRWYKVRNVGGIFTANQERLDDEYEASLIEAGLSQ